MKDAMLEYTSNYSLRSIAGNMDPRPVSRGDLT